jgi:hypothetical protein
MSVIRQRDISNRGQAANHALGIDEETTGVHAARDQIVASACAVFDECATPSRWILREQHAGYGCADLLLDDDGHTAQAVMARPLVCAHATRRARLPAAEDRIAELPLTRHISDRVELSGERRVARVLTEGGAANDDRVGAKSAPRFDDRCPDLVRNRLV